MSSLQIRVFFKKKLTGQKLSKSDQKLGNYNFDDGNANSSAELEKHSRRCFF